MPAAKPSKPRPDFPPYAHGNGQRAKKIRGKTHFFGPWGDPEAAFDKYLHDRDYLQAGRKVPDRVTGLTVQELVNAFRHHKEQRVESGELTPRCFANYHATGVRIANAFVRNRVVSDLRPEDFEAFRVELTRKLGPMSVRNEVRNTRTVFKYAYDAGLIEAPVRFGATFEIPSKRILRLARQAAGPRMFEAAELRTIVAGANGQLRAMIFLALNGGFGATDCASLPLSAVDLAGGWVDFPRPKTAVPRRIPLWPETIAALREAIDGRPRPQAADHERLVFLTKYGQPWVRVRHRTEEVKGRPQWTATDSVALVFGKLLTSLDLKRSA